ncbi:MAG: WD40/YVTN/BNR-like repeat-containing protein [Polyangiales bacterium]
MDSVRFAAFIACIGCVAVACTREPSPTTSASLPIASAATSTPAVPGGSASVAASAVTAPHDWVGHQVDVDTVPLRLGMIAFASFRTRDEGWLGDEDGRVLHTVDGGRSFAPVPPGDSPLAFTDASLGYAGGYGAKEYTARLEWLDEMQGFALLFPALMSKGSVHVGRALVTSDGGRTWTSSAFDGERVDFGDRVGQKIWLHVWNEATETLMRSSDGGASFTKLAHGGKCYDVSFADEKHGWCVTAKAIRATDDGGDTWTLIDDKPGKLGLRFDRVVRISRDVGWVRVLGGGMAMTEKTFVTRDGGKSWTPGPDQEAGDAPELGVRSHPVFVGHLPMDGHDRVVFADHAIAKLEDVLKSPPYFDRMTIAPWRDGAVVHAMAPSRLLFYSAGRRAFDWQPSELHGGRTESIVGVAREHEQRIVAWTEHAVIVSGDGGVRWMRQAILASGTLKRVVVDRPGERPRIGMSVFAETTDGRVFRSFIEGFQASEQPEMDRYDADVVEARRASKADPPSPARCLVDAKSASIRVEVVHSGCFHHDESAFEIEWTPTAASTTRDGHKSSVASDDAHKLATAIVTAIEQGNESDLLASTSSVSVRMTWSCNGASRQTMSERADDIGRGGGDDHDRAHRLLSIVSPKSL